MIISNPLLSLIKQVSYQVGGAHRIHEKKIVPQGRWTTGESNLLPHKNGKQSPYTKIHVRPLARRLRCNLHFILQRHLSEKRCIPQLSARFFRWNAEKRPVSL